MDQQRIVSSALAGLLALAAVGNAVAADKSAPKEKCFGIAKAGANDCANATGTHSCAGQASTDKAPEEWNYVAKGTCDKLGGKLAFKK
jgi:uncharacterized membrane protein